MRAGTAAGLLTIAVVFTSCSRTTTVSSRYVISTDAEATGCPYEWKAGDYWEFLAWAILDDAASAPALALTAGYDPGTFPAPGTTITIPLSPEYAEAARLRMEAARMVADATELRAADRDSSMALLRRAMDTDPAWSVPATNITVLLLEEGRTEEALGLLAPHSCKNTPAMVLAGIAWRRGSTGEALAHLREALAVDHPDPEVLAAAGMAWAVTGDRTRAGNAFRELLGNPDASPETRVEALRYALMLEEDTTGTVSPH